MKKISVLIPLPPFDYDPSEVAVSWKTLLDNGIDIDFATPNGQRAHADPLMLSGEGLDPWGFIPGLKKIRLVGLILRANRNARSAHQKMEQDPKFINPISYQAINPDNYDGLLLPGGHAKGMRIYLEDEVLQQQVVSFFESKNKDGHNKPIAAVCHGAVLAARSISKTTGKSVLYGLKTTALPWSFERKVSNLCKYYARWWDADYYRTYTEAPDQSEGYASVEFEIKRQLATPTDFLNAPKSSQFYFKKNSGIFRDQPNDKSPAWVVEDGHYISARWPGDIHSFAQQFVALLKRTYH